MHVIWEKQFMSCSQGLTWRGHHRNSTDGLQQFLSYDYQMKHFPMYFDV